MPGNATLGTYIFLVVFCIDEVSPFLKDTAKINLVHLNSNLANDVMPREAIEIVHSKNQGLLSYLVVVYLKNQYYQSKLNALTLQWIKSKGLRLVP